MNHRRRTRVDARKNVTVSWAAGSSGGELTNLSLKGCLVLGCTALPRDGEAVKVVIHLEPDARELDVEVLAQVVRGDERGLALDFTEVPAESFQHLFCLVQYNAPDPDQIEEELARSAFGAPEP